jgi:hypothetical protein
MFLDKHISQRQKHGILVCLLKSTIPRTPEDYRPISFLKIEYKLLARILARCLRHIITDQLQNSYFCGVPGNSTQDAISYLRDVLAHAEATDTLLCVLVLDFLQAFDLISHQYLFHILRRYGDSA